jgi:hypothetical protein
MAQTRTRDMQALRWQTFGFVLFAIVAVAGMTLGYVLQRRAHQRLGDQVVALERQVQELNVAVQQQRVKQAQLSSPALLRQRLQEFSLRLTNVNPSQRLFVTLPPAPFKASPPSPPGGPASARLVATLAAASR